MHSLSIKSIFSFLPMYVLVVIFQLKLVLGVKSDRSKFGFKMFLAVDLTKPGGHFFYLGL